MAQKRTQVPEEQAHGKAAPTAASDVDAPQHVPETAENFEHTIRRLIRQRNKDREPNAGIYR